jgi:translation elongation factor EF-Tu-like GTPase
MAGKKGLTAYINKGVILALNDIDVADDDELWEDVELTAPVNNSQASVPGTSTPQVSTAPEVTEEDDDLPF